VSGAQTSTPISELHLERNRRLLSRDSDCAVCEL
jgi:hypothetical protein